MPLSPTRLADALEQQWLARAGASMPGSAIESADVFARCVATWFAQAIAGPFPCSSALARQARLAALAAAALAAGSSAIAGSQLATAIAAYVTGQIFGPGIARPPSAVGLVTTEFAASFADLDASSPARARRMASACTRLAQSTLVDIPNPPSVVPIT